MRGYPEYPTTDDAFLRENAERAGMKSFKRAQDLALFARDIWIWQECGGSLKDPEMRFLIAELRRQGIGVKFSKRPQRA